MAKPLLMPQVGQDIETAIITKWLVKEGDYLKEGDIYVEVESEKAAFDVEAEESGTVLKLLYEEGEEVKVLEPIAYVGELGEKLEDTGKSDVDAAPKPQTVIKEKERVSEDAVYSEETKILAAPAARRVAKEHGIDLSKIRGSGPKGRIVKDDVLAAIDSGDFSEPAEPETRTVKQQMFPGIEDVLTEDREIPFSKMRKRIAARVSLSKQTIPHFYLFIDVKMSAVLTWRESFNRETMSKISVNDIIVKAVVSALAEYRALNAHIVEEKHILRKNINIGVAVSTEEGLLVPVIPDADLRDIQEISRLSKKIAEDARRGVLKAGSMSTFTVSNLGMYGINSFVPIVNPPECAILGVGSIVKKAVPSVDSGIDVCDMMTLTLACDHRAVDGAYASGFLNGVKRRLEEANL